VDRGLGYGVIRIRIARNLGVWLPSQGPVAATTQALTNSTPYTFLFFSPAFASGGVLEKRQVIFHPIWGYIDPFYEYKIPTFK